MPGLTSLSLIKHKILSDRPRIVSQFRRQLFPLGNQVLDTLLSLKDCSLLVLVRLLEQVLASFTGLSAKLCTCQKGHLMSSVTRRPELTIMIV